MATTEQQANKGEVQVDPLAVLNDFQRIGFGFNTLESFNKEQQEGIVFLLSLYADTAQKLSAVPFNPFSILSPVEVLKLGGKFSDQWKATVADGAELSNETRIMVTAKENSITSNDATFAVWIMNEAQSIISRERVGQAVESIWKQLPYTTSAKDSEIALNNVHSEYSKLTTRERKTAGIKVRDRAYEKLPAVMAQPLLDAVYSKLEITESDWKRSK